MVAIQKKLVARPWRFNGLGLWRCVTINVERPINVIDLRLGMEREWSRNGG
jgi:hypothetical protein